MIGLSAVDPMTLGWAPLGSRRHPPSHPYDASAHNTSNLLLLCPLLIHVLLE